MNNDFYKNLLLEHEDLSKQIADLTITLKAVEVLIPRYKTKEIASNTTEVIYPAVQNENLKREYKVGERVTDRIIEVLSVLGRATAIEVSDALVEFYPDQFDEEKSRSAASVNLSKLKSENKVQSEKLNGKNQFIYWLTDIKENPAVDEQPDRVK